MCATSILWWYSCVFILHAAVCTWRFFIDMHVYVERKPLTTRVQIVIFALTWNSFYGFHEWQYSKRFQHLILILLFLTLPTQFSTAIDGREINRERERVSERVWDIGWNVDWEWLRQLTNLMLAERFITWFSIRLNKYVSQCMRSSAQTTHPLPKK